MEKEYLERIPMHMTNGKRERVVSVVPRRDDFLVFTDQGRMFEVWQSQTNDWFFRAEAFSTLD